MSTKQKFLIVVNLPDGRRMEMKSVRQYEAATIGTYPDGRVKLFSHHATLEVAAKVAARKRGEWLAGGWDPAKVPTFEAVRVDSNDPI